MAFRWIVTLNGVLTRSASGITTKLTGREQAGANDVDFRTRSTRRPVPGRVERLVMLRFNVRKRLYR